MIECWSCYHGHDCGTWYIYGSCPHPPPPPRYFLTVGRGSAIFGYLEIETQDMLLVAPAPLPGLLLMCQRPI